MNSNHSSKKHDHDLRPEPMLDKLLGIIRQISEVIAHSNDNRFSLQQVVRLLASNLQADACSIYVYNSTTEKLMLIATHGLNPETVGVVEIEAGKGLVGEAFKSRQIINIKNPQEHPSFKYYKQTGEEKFNSYFAVPLILGSNPIGVIVIQTVYAEEFPPIIVDTMRSLSPQLANLIFNSGMVECLVSTKKSLIQPRIPQSKGDTPILLRGISVSKGVAVGTAYKLKTNDVFANIRGMPAADPAKEEELLLKAIQLTKQQTLLLEKRAISLLSEADSSIFVAHLLMLEDKLLIDSIKNLIFTHRLSVEPAIKNTFLSFEQKFSKLNDHVFRDRINDLKDILLRLVENIALLRANPNLEEHLENKTVKTEDFKRKLILICHTLLPSQLLRLPLDSIMGIVCDSGSSTSHVAILAKALEIPALLNVNNGTKIIEENDDLILDANEDTLFIRPSATFTEKYISTVASINEESNAIFHTIPGPPTPAYTIDRIPIVLRANLSLLAETYLLKSVRSQGVGLYRSEFLFMVREQVPTEEDQLNVFSKLIKEANGEPVTIRILDIGADKPVPCLGLAKEQNPALGIRGIRLMFERPDVLRPHLRAILRAGIHGPIKILLPMVSSTYEILQFRQILQEVEQQLADQNIPHYSHAQLGIMIEIPSFIYELKFALPYLDFISIGSNDLLQYTFAVDRTIGCLNSIFSPFNATFFSMLKDFADLANANHLPICICGELASNRLAIPVLIGLNYHELSVTPRRIPFVRDVINKFTSLECQEIAQKVTHFDLHFDIQSYLIDCFMKKDLATNTTVLPVFKRNN